MPLHPEWTDIALRLVLTLLASALIGLNRNERGKPAGLRTTMLVALAAALSMILANYLLATTGKASDSFVVLDLMRLPLGVLTGMGFIGAGTVLRRGDAVVGVTTAATLWFVTMMGLCFGAGAYEIGIAATVIGLLILWGMKKIEDRLRQDRHGTLILCLTPQGPSEHDLRTLFESAGYHIDVWSLHHTAARRKIQCILHWSDQPNSTTPPPFLSTLCANPEIQKVQWLPVGSATGSPTHRAK